MAIVRKNTDPFLEKESGIKALSLHLGGEYDCALDRAGRYCLEILNRHIHEGQNLSQRLPQEIFGGLPEGGRRHVCASLLERAVSAADREEQEKILPSGYTRTQQAIGSWAERDGCWSDEAESDQARAGRQFLTSGAEAYVYRKDLDHRVFKTIDSSHYGRIAQLLDRITIHNAVFPETAMRVEGFGLRDDADDHHGFVVVISQEWVTGEAPESQDVIDREMEKRGFRNLTETYGFDCYASDSGNTLLSDIHDLNCVMSPGGHLLVFDCVATPNVFGFGSPRYNFPDVSWSREAVDEIERTLQELVPRSVPVGDILAGLPKDLREDIAMQLDQTGRINGILRGKLVQRDPDHPGLVLVSRPDQVGWMMSRTTVPEQFLSPLTDNEYKSLIHGESIRRGGASYAFDLDKGRIDKCVVAQRKLRQTVTRTKTVSL